MSTNKEGVRQKTANPYSRTLHTLVRDEVAPHSPCGHDGGHSVGEQTRVGCMFNVLIF